MRKFLLSLLLLATSLCAQNGARMLEDLAGKRHRVDYLVVGPAAWYASVEPLMLLREERGMRTRFASIESIEAAFDKGGRAERIQAFLQHAFDTWKESPRWVLLAADAASSDPEVPVIPGFEVAAPSIGSCTSDNPYADYNEDGLPDLALGRFPAQTQAELEGMVARTIAYERERAAGLWQRRFSFVAGEGGFGPALDMVLENVFSQVVSQIPSAYDVVLTYRNPSSPYCYPLAAFSERVLEQLNQGALFLTYVGHGAARSFDKRILHVDDVPQVRCSASPIVVVIACSTGHYDDPRRDCIGEALLKKDEGPVAFIGSSRVSQPYPNGLLGLGMVRQMFSSQGTVGELLQEAKRRVLADPEDTLRGQIDMMAGMFLDPKTQAEQQREQLALYNLLGDPALMPAYPDQECALEAAARADAGTTISVEGSVEGLEKGHVLLSLEVERTAFVGEFEPVPAGAGAAEVRLRNYQRANDKTLLQVEGELVDGRFVLEFQLPEDLPSGTAVLKAFVTSSSLTAVGARAIELGKE